MVETVKSLVVVKGAVYVPFP